MAGSAEGFKRVSVGARGRRRPLADTGCLTSFAEGRRAYAPLRGTLPVDATLEGAVDGLGGGRLSRVGGGGVESSTLTQSGASGK